ncbi:MAG: PQQ-binding-like beta-propeller repeat protein [Planctomycetaceae bacterium]
MAQVPPVADAPGAAVPEHKHGLPEILTQQLFRDRKVESLLRTAESVRDVRGAGRLRESLLAIFAWPHDVFEFDVRNKALSSLRSRALELLHGASGEIQAFWVTSNRVIAAQELESALQHGSRRDTASVAQRFPMTEAGLRAEVIDLTCEFLKGDVPRVVARVRELESNYTGTVLQTELKQQLGSLKLQLANSAAGSETLLSTRLSIQPENLHGSIAPPWPQPLWTWRESVGDFPTISRIDMAAFLSEIAPETARRLDLFNNWRSVFWDASIVIRTPFRIVALDRARGDELWSIPTDTFRPRPATVSGEPDHSGHSGFRQSQNDFDRVSPVYGMAEFGLLAADREFLFFIDRFDLHGDTSQFADNLMGRVIRSLNGFPVIEENEESDKMLLASRLVAIRHRADSDLPYVAWQIGDGAAYAYQPVRHPDVATSGDVSQKTPVISSATSEAQGVHGVAPISEHPWRGHRFLSPPTGEGTRLFVLTASDNQVFLNCLQRNTGRLQWRQPLAYGDDNSVSVIDASIFAKRASICLVDQEVVVCSLADGILTGVSALNGRLLWASAIRDAASTAPQFRFGRPFPHDQTAIPSPSIMVPHISGGMIVCCNHYSTCVTGLSLQNGEIVWRTERQASGPGEIGGSADFYIAGITGLQVILVGARHCRSLDLKTGEQKWAVEIQGISGLAECRGNRCVIPVSSGQAATVNLETGTLIPESFIGSPHGSKEQTGGLTMDDELICVTTPVGIDVFPRADAVFDNPKQLAALAPDAAAQVRIRAEAHLINGDIDASLQVLRDAVTSSASRGTSETETHKIFAELILERWGQAFSDFRESDDRGAGLLSKLPAVELPSDAALLSGLSLSPELQFRMAVLQQLSESAAGVSNSTPLAELQRHDNWQLPVRLTAAWSVRPDLLIDSSDSAVETDPGLLGRLSIQELRDRTSWFLQHPDVMPDDVQREQFAQHLLRRGEFAAAELMLIRWCESVSRPGHASSERALGLLQQLRAFGESSDLKYFKPGITSETAAPLTFELVPFIRRPDADFEAMSHQVGKGLLPSWNRTHTYLTNDTPQAGHAAGGSRLLTIDPRDGAMRDELSLPFAVIPTAGTFVPLSDGLLTPGLFPVCSAEELAMISCPVSGKASVLWRRRLERHESSGNRVEFGSLGSAHLIWHFGNKLHCSDPMTGVDLWTRKTSLTSSQRDVFHREFNPPRRRIAGDGHTTVVVGRDAESYKLFDTRDGAPMGRGQLEIRDPDSVIAIGRCLLYVDASGRLQLFDCKSQENKLAECEAILPVYRDDRLLWQILENDRLLVVSENSERLELVLLDVQRGTVVFCTPVSKYMGPGAVASFSAFERNGRLFAGLSGAGRSRRSIQAAFARNAPFLSNGPLLCLEPTTGHVNWSVNIEQAIFPDLHGDPTDLLLSWTSPRHIMEGHIGDGVEDRLLLQVFDETTGQLIAESPTFPSLPPLRCVHLADQNLIQLTSPNATILIRVPESPQSQIP